jgi:hypothetical protein
VIWILGLKVSGGWRGLERRERSLKGRERNVANIILGLVFSMILFSY